MCFELSCGGDVHGDGNPCVKQVPDVHHILHKGGGVFCSPSAPSAPCKLRLLYEVAPLARIVEAAGGRSYCRAGSALDETVTTADVRVPVCLGSATEVQRSEEAMAAST